MKYLYNNKLLDGFFKALFASDQFGFETATENAKTDNYDFNFTAWKDMLIETYADEEDVDIDDLTDAVNNSEEFLKDLEAEHEELGEFIDED